MNFNIKIGLNGNIHGFRTKFTLNQPIKCFTRKTHNFEPQVYGLGLGGRSKGRKVDCHVRN